MRVADFSGARLHDLAAKGTQEALGQYYNPDGVYEAVTRFTPHAEDIEFSEYFLKDKVNIRPFTVSLLNPMKIFRGMRSILRGFKADDIDVVRGRNTYTASLWGAIGAKLAGLPFVVSLGGDNRLPQRRNGIYQYDSKRLSYFVEWLVLKLSTAIMCPNEHTSDYVASIIGTKKKNHVIPWLALPVTDSGDANLQSLGIPEQAFIIPVVGFLNKYKYTDTIFEVVDALPRLTAHGSKVLFVFCGDGPLREAGEERFSHRDDVLFLGWQKKSVVNALLKRAGLVVIPMSGFVLLEAASIGKPVITSNVEWHTELVRDGKTGLTVSPLEVKEWEMAIKKFIADPELARRCGDNLEAEYRKGYSRDRVVKMEFDLYTSLSGGGRNK